MEGPFKRLDLHVHTPKSLCYLDNVEPGAGRRTQAADIVNAARAAGLDAIAVTDHNTAERIDWVREAARDASLVVFPGVEVTTKAGHLLALFDPSTPSSHVAQVVRFLGFKPEEEGDAYYWTSAWMGEACHVVQEAGGVAVAAHVDRRPRGFIATPEPLSEKQRIYNNEYLSAIEITLPQDKARWNSGAVPNYVRRHACLQNSDSHAPGEIGRRYTLARVPELNITWLRTAIQQHNDLLRFPHELNGAGL